MSLVPQKQTVFSINSLYKIIFLSSITLLAITLFFLFSLNNSFVELSLAHDNFVVASTNREAELVSIVLELDSQRIDLNQSLAKLESDYVLLLNKATSLESSYTTLKNEANQTISKIIDYENQIQSSLEWFNSNSFIDSKKNSRVISTLKSNCLNQTSRACEINLGCFHLVNSEFLNYSYKDDLVTSSAIDKLQSLEEFVSNKGGDCEDFALFFKAEYNSLVSECPSSPTLFGWVRNKNETFWANNNQTWYLSNAKKKFLSKENIFPVIVCGNIFDPKSNQINGHCVIAFTPKKIVSISDTSALLTAELIEPQSGEYLGVIGVDSNIFLSPAPNGALSFINTLITGDDYFLFTKNEWVNYALFGEELSLHKQKIIGLVNQEPN